MTTACWITKPLGKAFQLILASIGVTCTIIIAVLPAFAPIGGAAACFTFMTRTEWDANPPKEVEKFAGPIPFVIIHHSYIPAACYSDLECQQAMQSMQKSHQQERGWNDIGYSFAIGGNGKIYEGRGFNVVGAHAPRYNDKSVGIVLIGDWRTERPPEVMIKAAQELIAYGVHTGIIAGNYTLIGHRQTRPTECPGDRLFQEIQTWPHFSPMWDVVDPNSIKT